MKTAVLKPSRTGLIVRDPLTLEPLPEAGESKPLNAYWRRRRSCGDVVEVPSKSPAKSPRRDTPGGDT